MFLHFAAGKLRPRQEAGIPLFFAWPNDAVEKIKSTHVCSTHHLEDKDGTVSKIENGAVGDEIRQ